MKKYFAFLPLIVSCNTRLGTSNNIIENQDSINHDPGCFSGSGSDAPSIMKDDKCFQGIDIASAGNGKYKDDLLDHGLIYKDGLMCQYGFGNDACFISTESQGVTFGVADGAGKSWLAGRFSRKLMKHIALSSFKSPKEKIKDSYLKISKEYEDNVDVYSASTTVVVGTIVERHLKYAYLGGSILMIVRNNQVLFKTEVQYHRYNSPYQLGVMKHGYFDDPSKCISGEYKLEHGDLVIMGTDGVFDNLNDEEIVSIINTNDGQFAEVIAKKIEEEALKNSKDNNKFTPRTEKLRDLNKTNEGYEGGKPDDISVIVAIVK